MTTASAWTGVRINYHEPDKAALLTGAIAPIMSHLDRYGARRGIFRPHWRFGPHAVFALDLAANPGQSVAFPDEALAIIRDWIATHPSTSVVDTAEYLAASHKRGKAEGIEGPYLPLTVNNSVIPLGANAIDTGDDASLTRITHDFHAATLPLMIELAAMRDDPDTFWVRLGEMFACAASLAGPAGIAGGHLSFRSHAEGFLSGAPPIRPRFEAFVDRYGDATTERVRTIDRALRTDSGGRTLNSFLARWFSALIAVKAAIDKHVETIPVEQLDGQSPGAGDRKPGAFEKMVLNGALRQLRGNRQFVAYRLLLSSTYGLLPTIGVKPVERFAICHLVAEVGTRIYAVDWQHHLSGGAGAGSWFVRAMMKVAQWKQARTAH